MKLRPMSQRNVFMSLAVLAMCVLCIGQVTAQTEQEKLPDGKALVAKNLKVTGADKAFDKINNTVMTAVMSIEAQGIDLNVTRYATKPNKYYAKIEVPGLMEIERGCDGKVYWEINSMTGPRLIEGDEMEMQKHFGHFDMKDWEKRFKKIETLGVEKVGDEECYKVKLTPLKAKPYTVFFSKASGLEVKQLITASTPAGEIQAEHLISDYKVVDGVKIPHKLVEKAMGQEIVITTTSVKNNQELPKGIFDLPEEIKALLK